MRTKNVKSVMIIVFVLCFSEACGSAALSTPHPQVGQVTASSEEMPAEEVDSDLQVDESESREHLVSEDLPSCTAQQVNLFDKGLESTSNYIEEFIKGMAQFDQMSPRSESDPLGLRRSQMMIFFGDGLIKRLEMIKQISRCDALVERFTFERRALYQKAERLNVR